jgi:hypothetical protein
MPLAYLLVFARNFQVSLSFIDHKHHAAIREGILEQLTHEPLVQTRNRKPLDPAIFGATWELRCGPQNRYRVLYEVIQFERDKTDEEAQEEPDEVHVLLIGEKIGERLMIAGKEGDDETDSTV